MPELDLFAVFEGLDSRESSFAFTAPGAKQKRERLQLRMQWDRHSSLVCSPPVQLRAHLVLQNSFCSQTSIGRGKISGPFARFEFLRPVVAAFVTSRSRPRPWADVCTFRHLCFSSFTYRAITCDKGNVPNNSGSRRTESNRDYLGLFGTFPS